MARRLADRVGRTLELPADAAARAEKLRDTEWLVTNGLGGYSSLSVPKSRSIQAARKPKFTP